MFFLKEKKKKPIKKKVAKPQRNVFAGADDIYLTNTKIAIRKVKTSYGKNGKSHFYDHTKYVPKNSKNMYLLNKNVGKVRFGR